MTELANLMQWQGLGRFPAAKDSATTHHGLTQNN
eukprot:CAMPEP_0172869642 /NCGR_PEP_ID=MMETSP1075-20121228/89615_1 /TAXON_ID=2916 /ORGANISM="Ceratium fusus, Strain PA161109" /LENGTH=33 /DNA_ID= /DNA_START= /DNA_END= /DNA_ORIENTATION=